MNGNVQRATGNSYELRFDTLKNIVIAKKYRGLSGLKKQAIIKPIIRLCSVLHFCKHPFTTIIQKNAKNTPRRRMLHNLTYDASQDTRR